MRINGRKNDELRKIEIIPDINIFAEGSCLIKCGNTQVLCTATVEEKVPAWLKDSGKGWVTAEYSMLPRANRIRTQREIKALSGRTQEIQRLIGRSLRSVVDLSAIKDHTITVDCDVLQGDGGTRTASITGGFVAMYLAVQKMRKEGKFIVNPIKEFVAAVSCGIVDGEDLLDLEYAEDSNAQADTNFVLSSSGKIIEVQGTAEGEPFEEERFLNLMNLAKKGIAELTDIQHKAIAKGL